MILPKGISGRPASLSDTVSGHALWQTKANQMKMFKMPTPCVHLHFKPKFLKIQKLYQIRFFIWTDNFPSPPCTIIYGL